MDTQALALRVPPHSVEAEASVLGGLLLDNSAWDRIGDLVRPGDFYRADHRLIFECISKLIDGGKPADVVTVYEALQSLGKADDIGGIAYLNTLASETPSASNIRRYAEIVRDRSILRHLVSVSDEIATQALNPAGKETRQVLDEAESRIFQIGEAGARTTGGFQDFHSVLARVVEKVDDLYHNPNPSDVTGVPSGFVDLDQKTAGMHAGDLLIIAGRPSMGKTSLALNVAEYVAITEKLPVAVFSMEMGAEQLAMRVLCSVGKLDAQRVRTGRLTEDDWNRLTQAMGRMKEAQIHIDETPALNPLELRSRARRLSRQYGKLGLIVVDYLQLMSASSSGENRTTEISEITRSLKGLAKELGCPVLALSQLNRTVEQRTDKRPVMSDLRECVVGETLVSLADGSRKPIRELVGQAPEVLAIDQQQKVITAKAEVIWSVGEKETFKVSMASGRSLVASAEHRVLTGSGWKTVAEIKTGERLIVVERVIEPALLESSGIADSEELEAELLDDTVVSVSAEGRQEVFDLTVPGPASWVSDGIVNHNSGAIEQDADVILFIYRDEVYRPDTPDKGVAEIIIAKQRNGPIGTVRMTFLGQFTKFENFAPPAPTGFSSEY